MCYMCVLMTEISGGQKRCLHTSGDQKKIETVEQQKNDEKHHYPEHV